MCVGVVVLAAGAASRMGRPKQLLPWRDTTIIGHILDTWRGLLVSQLAVVHDPNQTAVRAELERLNVGPGNLILNPQVEQGMFGSIQAAARWPGWDKKLTHWAIVLGDQPQLKAALLRGLLECVKQSPDNIWQPSFHGRARHPVLVPKDLSVMLGESSCKTLKEFLQPLDSRIRLLESDDEGLNFDIDTPAEYEAARKLFGG